MQAISWVAVTTGEVWSERQSSMSSLYVFDQNLQQLGVVSGLGKGESIFSVRFMQDRAYVVTFKKIDPFYVLDLSEPTNPQVLGELKIPGFSDYLHPYDENHIIGFGKNAADAPGEAFAWYQGLKIALFDVTNPTDPQVLHEVEIGDRGSESEALDNHKAFLFDRVKDLLVIPAEINNISDKSTPVASEYGTRVFSGFIAYSLNLDDGFVERGKVEIDNDSDVYYWWGSRGSRSLYIGDYLINLANGKLHSSTLDRIELTDVLDLNDS